MKITWKTTAAVLCYLLGIVGWCYVGGYMILAKPVKGLVVAYLAGKLSIWKIVIAIVQGFVYLSLAGGVWCVGYMLSNYIKEH